MSKQSKGKSAFNLSAHIAALGLRFYTGNQFPQEYTIKFLWRG